MVKYIKAGVTIITNNGNIINEENPSQATIILLGGELRYMKGAMVGDFAEIIWRRLRPKRALWVQRISPDMG